MKKSVVNVVVLFSVFGFALFLFFLLSHNSFTGYFVYSYQPNATFGVDSYVRNGTSSNFGGTSTLKVGKTAAGQEMRSLLFFNFSSIPVENTVTSAKLQLYLALSSDNSSTTIVVKRVTREWVESELTWDDRKVSTPWFSSGGDFDSEVIGSLEVSNQTGLYNFSFDSLAQGWVDGSFENYGLVLLAESPDSNEVKEFYSSDYSNASLRPLVFVEHQENALPVIENISTSSNFPFPKKPGEALSITVNWSDLDSSQSRFFACNSSSISLSGCGDLLLCNTSFSSVNPSSCNYTVSFADNRTTIFYVSVCDASNCSVVNASSFVMNHLPSVTVEQPDGGEVINQSQGSYSVEFTVSDSDSDFLVADLYYGSSQGSLANTLVSGLNLSLYCSDPDSDTSTSNACSYSWDSSGVYGSFYLTVVLNDSYHVSNDSSNNNFSVVSLQDTVNPLVDAQWIDSGRIFSGRSTPVYANITEVNLDSVWVQVNYSSVNYSLSNVSGVFTTNLTAPSVGVYSFRVFANDTVGNSNDTMPWVVFSVEKPVANASAVFSSSTALPYSTIKISSYLNASDSLDAVYAYLNVPSGFTFLSGYPQNVFSGDYGTNGSNVSEWFLSVPLTESSYTFNVTYTDQYGNSWDSPNGNVLVTSSVGSGYDLAITGYPEVETSTDYFVNAYFTSAGSFLSADSVFLTLYDSLDNVVVGPVSMVEESVGVYNYSYAIGAAVNEGQWETLINVTKDGVSYFGHEFWRVVGGPFDLRDIVVLNSSVDNLQIQVTAENTGGANKDLITVWNLTRESDGLLLDSGSDTFLVPAAGEVNYTVTPDTSFVGQVRITFLGTYSGSEKIGAYEVFSTTLGGGSDSGSSGGGSGGSSGGGGSGSSIDSLFVSETVSLDGYGVDISAPKTVYLSKNDFREVEVIVKNIGSLSLNNLEVFIPELPLEFYSVIPERVNVLPSGNDVSFVIKFFISEDVVDEKITFFVSSDSLNYSYSSRIVMLTVRDLLMVDINELKVRVASLKDEYPHLNAEIVDCEGLVFDAEEFLRNEQFIAARESVGSANGCLDNLSFGDDGSWFSISVLLWIFIIVFLFFIVLILSFFLWKLYRSINIMNFLKSRESVVSSRQKEREFKSADFDSRMRKVEDRLGIDKKRIDDSEGS